MKADWPWIFSGVQMWVDEYRHVRWLLWRRRKYRAMQAYREAMRRHRRAVAIERERQPKSAGPILPVGQNNPTTLADVTMRRLAQQQQAMALALQQHPDPSGDFGLASGLTRRAIRHIPSHRLMYVPGSDGQQGRLVRVE